MQGILTKKQIIEYMENGSLRFSPEPDTLQIQLHSVDLRLGFSFMIPKSWEMTERGREAFLIDYTDDRKRFDVIELEKGQFFDILPREALIVSSLEEVCLPRDIMAVLYPRSSVNRRGLAVDLSGIVDAGYEGRLLIPVQNNTNSQVIRVYPGERFCQLVFYPLSSEAEDKKSRWYKKDIIVGRLNELHKEEEEMILHGNIKDLKSKYSIVNLDKGE